MQLARRKFLMRSVAAGLGLVIPTQLQAQRLSSRQAPLASTLSYHSPTLAAFVDTILPDDGVTPAASALGVDKDLIEFLLTVPEVGETAIIMCDWLDKPGPIRFSMRSALQRLEIVDLISTAPVNTMEGWFYNNMRLLAIEFFYARPEALVGLELSAAPQPEGYLPPWD